MARCPYVPKSLCTHAHTEIEISYSSSRKDVSGLGN